MDRTPPDFFISRAGPDAPLAAEIGRILEAEGHSVFLQEWDFANRNFVERMHAALESGARVIALLSNAYLASDHCTAEWQNAIAHDPLNKAGRLIVLRVAEATPTGLLTAIAYWDLVPLRDNSALLRDIVLHAVQPADRNADPVALRQYWQPPRPVLHPEIHHTPSFTGRKAELASIGELLRAGLAAITQPVAAHGLGGIGKSVLAREYAHLHQPDYAGVWWLHAAKTPGGPGFDGVERGLVELGAVFIRGLDQARDRAAAARQTLDFLAHGGFEKPWLLIYDNVDDARLLRDWLPIDNAHVLMTTRIGGWPGRVGTVEITAWSPAEARRYLHEESGRADLGEADAGAVAEALGCLPLALSHAAALLRARPNITPERYFEGLARRMNEAPADAAYPRSVFATFHDALEQAEAAAPGARAVMSLATFFAPDDVPEELFQQPAECYPPPLAELTRDEVDEAIGALANISLIDFTAATRTFSTHRLVLAAARDALGDQRQYWSGSALRALDSAFPEPQPTTWRACERLVSHARTVAIHLTKDSGELALLVGRTGSYLEERAALAEVLPLFERVRGIFERLAAEDRGNAVWERGLAVSFDKIGDVQTARGHLEGAFQAFQDSLKIRKKLAAEDRGNAVWQRDLSVSFGRIGNVQTARGHLDRALQAYRDGLAIAQNLVAQDRGNAVWQRDLAVSFNKIGDVQTARGHLDGAFQAYQDSFAIVEELAAQDRGNAEWQRDLEVSFNKIGSVLTARGHLDGALKAHEEGLAIAQMLAAQDRSNAVWQRDLSVSFDLIGNVQTARGHLDRALQAYRDGLAIAQNLVAQDRGNAVWQRDLAVSFNKIGDVQTARGHLDGAFKAYQDSLKIRKKLAEEDRGNAVWQRDLSVSLNKIGDVQTARGNLEGALQAFQDSHAIFVKLAAQDPGNAEWQRDLIVSNVKLAEVASALDERGGDAQRYYRSALDAALELRDQGRLKPVDAWMVAELETRLARASTTKP